MLTAVPPHLLHASSNQPDKLNRFFALVEWGIGKMLLKSYLSGFIQFCSVYYLYYSFIKFYSQALIFVYL